MRRHNNRQPRTGLLLCVSVQILLRYEIAPEASTFTLPNMNLSGTSVHACVSLSKVQLMLRYTSTDYGLLCKQAVLHANVEGTFQVQPDAGAHNQRTDLKVRTAWCE